MDHGKKKYILIKDLEIYRLGRKLSKIGWQIYEQLDWKAQKTMGDQFISATDSCGANITEGYGRFHYLDKIKFMYNARASLAEASDYWLELLLERKLVKKEKYSEYKKTAEQFSIKLQNFISALYKAKNSTK